MPTVAGCLLGEVEVESFTLGAVIGCMLVEPDEVSRTVCWVQSTDV